MPLIETSGYRPPFGFRGGHVGTVWPVLFRRKPVVVFARERIETPDGDFLDIDRVGRGGGRAVILLHGLEGCTRTHYMRGMAAAFSAAAWDVLAVNFRGCSGEPNRLLRSYHSGATEDLVTVVAHACEACGYGELALVGFSLGGNLMLKYLGDAGEDVDRRIRAAVAISVPCDLASSARRLAVFENRIYMRRFLRFLRAKIRVKAALYPGEVDLTGLDQIRDFIEFDDRYTAPIHGFADAEDYWRRCSCRAVLPRIAVPTLILNACNDPFLTPACYPHEEAAASAQVFLEIPASGGHVGFVSRGNGGQYWSEERALEFVCFGSKPLTPITPRR